MTLQRLCPGGPAGGLDCVTDELPPSAWWAQNGFLARSTFSRNQPTAGPLSTTIHYYDAADESEAILGDFIAQQKMDFIINDGPPA